MVTSARDLQVSTQDHQMAMDLLCRPSLRLSRLLILVTGRKPMSPAQSNCPHPQLTWGTRPNGLAETADAHLGWLTLMSK